jgi:hypothetical protein
MKIIITESQYDNLFTDKNYRLVANMWDNGMDTSDIAEFTGLRESSIIYLLREKQININCSFADTILQTLFNTSLIDKNFHGENETLRLAWAFGGMISFDYEDSNYVLRGVSTPYWNGDCITPVDSYYFEDKKTGEYEDENDKLEMNTDYTPSSFDSIQELIDFLNNEYPKELVRTIKKIIKKRSFN